MPTVSFATERSAMYNDMDISISVICIEHNREKLRTVYVAVLYTLGHDLTILDRYVSLCI